MTKKRQKKSLITCLTYFLKKIKVQKNFYVKKKKMYSKKINIIIIKASIEIIYIIIVFVIITSLGSWTAAMK